MWVDIKQKVEYIGKDNKQAELNVYVNDEDEKFIISINSGVLFFSRTDILDNKGDVVAMGLELKDLEYFIKKMKESK